MVKKTTLQLIRDTMRILREKKRLTASQLSKELNTNWNSVKNAVKIMELFGTVRVRKIGIQYVIDYIGTRNEIMEQHKEKLKKKIAEINKMLLRLYRANDEEREELISNIIMEFATVRTLAEKIAEGRP